MPRSTRLVVGKTGVFDRLWWLLPTCDVPSTTEGGYLLTGEASPAQCRQNDFQLSKVNPTWYHSVMDGAEGYTLSVYGGSHLCVFNPGGLGRCLQLSWNWKRSVQSSSKLCMVRAWIRATCCPGPRGKHELCCHIYSILEHNVWKNEKVFSCGRSFSYRTVLDQKVTASVLCTRLHLGEEVWTLPVTGEKLLILTLTMVVIAKVTRS